MVLETIQTGWKHVDSVLLEIFPRFLQVVVAARVRENNRTVRTARVSPPLSQIASPLKQGLKRPKGLMTAVSMKGNDKRAL